MPNIYNRDTKGLSTSVNVSQGAVKKQSRTNFSSAKNFLSKDISSGPNLPSKLNDEHLVEHSTAINSIGLIASSAASVAKDNLDTTRAILADIRGGNLSSAKDLVPHINNKNAASMFKKHSDSIIEKASSTDEITKTLIKNLTPSLVKQKLLTKEKSQSSFSNSNGSVDAPQIEYIVVETDKSKGKVDSFYCEIAFSLEHSKIENNTIKGIRIFRAEVDGNEGIIRKENTLSFFGVQRLTGLSSRTSIKNNNLTNDIERSLSSANINNSIKNLTAIDPIRGLRTTQVSSSLSRNVLPQQVKSFEKNKSLISSFLIPETFMKLDTSVLNDLNSIRNIQVQNKDLTTSPVIKQVFGKNLIPKNGNINPEQMRQVSNQTVEKTGLIIESNNNQGYKEIAFFSPANLTVKSIIGSQIEYSYEDRTVTFGKTYKYYIVYVDENMVDSLRSRIVDVSIDAMRVPENPKTLIAQYLGNFVSLSMTVEDHFVEKFEIYRKDFYPNSKDNFEVIKLSDNDGNIINNDTSERSDNGFVYLGDAHNSISTGGSRFQDKNVTEGKKYLYRVYCVDIFGNKSESPKETDIFIPNKSGFVDLSTPNIVVEVEQQSQKMKITFSNSDDRVVGFFLERKDLTLNQLAYTTPYNSNGLKLGRRSRLLNNQNNIGEVLSDKTSLSDTWTGFFSRTDNSQHVFIDKTTQIDHVYQYRIYSFDKFGNKSHYAFSSKTMLIRRPIVNSPINLSGEVSVDNSGDIQGVKLTWNDGNDDISSEDKIGNLQTLADNSTRSLFQIERRKDGENRWLEFPMVDSTTFLDKIKIKSEETPSFRPDFLEKGKTYFYRLQSMQSGTFISNYSDVVQITIEAPVLSPANFNISSPSTKVKPFYAMLNWDTQNSSGIVDKWEIQRAIVNNLASKTINIKNPNDLDKLPFSAFRTVYRESSRFQSKELDSIGRSVSTSIISGQHHFMDTDIVFGNSYYYKIRSISTSGLVSDWSFKAIRIQDENFDYKQNQLLSAEEKQTLTTDLIPVSVKTNILSPRIETTMNSDSLLANFSKPSIDFNSLGNDILQKDDVINEVPLENVGVQSIISNSITKSLTPSLSPTFNIGVKQVVTKINPTVSKLTNTLIKQPVQTIKSVTVPTKVVKSIQTRFKL